MNGMSVNLGSVYLGSDDEGVKLKQRINAVCAKRKANGTIRSLSELIREYVVTGLLSDEHKSKSK
jgi:hypothetical protein